MDRPYEADTLATAPVMPPNLPNGFPSDGDPNAGRLATEPGAYWFHAVNEEIRNVIVEAGLAPDNAELNQLYLAIRRMLQQERQNTMAVIHPVGSLYMTTVAGDPAEIFGGTWERFAQGRMLVSAQDSGTYAAGNTGGSENITLSVNHLPAHSHSAWTDAQGGHAHDRGNMNIYGEFRASTYDTYTSGAFTSGDGGGGGRPDKSWARSRYYFNANRNWAGVTNTVGVHGHNVGIGNTGGGQAFSLLSPWQAVYVWRRTA